MSAKDKPVSKPMSQQFADNYDRIFNKKKRKADKVGTQTKQATKEGEK